MLPAERREAGAPCLQPLAQDLGNGVADIGIGMVQHSMLRIFTDKGCKAITVTMRRILYFNILWIEKCPSSATIFNAITLVDERASKLLGKLRNGRLRFAITGSKPNSETNFCGKTAAKAAPVNRGWTI